MINPAKISLQWLYDELYKYYGSQGWWPLLRLKPEINPTKRGRYTGYHPEDYKTPNNENEIFEILLGTILTQNTSWINAEKALWNLSQHHLIEQDRLRKINIDDLALLIRSSGYFNQKAIKIQNLLHFLEKTPIMELSELSIKDLRDKLLSIKGVGPETADSIILYAFKKPIFVIDAYTKRLLIRLGKIDLKSSYEFVQSLFHQQIERNVEIYNEFHALIVQHCVHICTSKPQCDKCFLAHSCLKIIISKPKKKKVKKKFKKESPDHPHLGVDDH